MNSQRILIIFELGKREKRVLCDADVFVVFPRSDFPQASKNLIFNRAYGAFLSHPILTRSIDFLLWRYLTDNHYGRSRSG